MKKSSYLSASMLAAFISLYSGLSAATGSPTPAPRQSAAEATAVAEITAIGAVNQSAAQKLHAEQTQKAIQTQNQSGEVSIGDTRGGSAYTKSGDAKTVSGPATTIGGSAKGGISTTMSGPANTKSGDITQTVGAIAEGNKLETGDVTLKDVGNARVQSDISVDGAKQEQKAIATNQGVTGNSVTIDNRPVRQAVPAYAPPIYQQGGCPGSSVSGGLSGVWGGISGGKATIDKECQINAAETTVLQANQQVAYGSRLAARFAVRMRCKSELLGFTSEECIAMEQEVMAKFDADEARAAKLAEANAERTRLLSELAQAKAEVARASSTPKVLTTKELEASEQRILAAMQNARLKSELSVVIPERVWVPCTEKNPCTTPKTGYYRYPQREAKAKNEALVEQNTEHK